MVLSDIGPNAIDYLLNGYCDYLDNDCDGLLHDREVDDDDDDAGDDDDDDAGDADVGDDDTAPTDDDDTGDLELSGCECHSAGAPGTGEAMVVAGWLLVALRRRGGTGGRPRCRVDERLLDSNLG